MNIIFFAIYLAEMIIKILGFGVKGYFSDGFNVFDFFLVLASIVDIIFANTSEGENQTTSVLQTLRGFRLFRMFKLAR